MSVKLSREDLEWSERTSRPLVRFLNSVTSRLDMVGVGPPLQGRSIVSSDHSWIRVEGRGRINKFQPFYLLFILAPAYRQRKWAVWEWEFDLSVLPAERQFSALEFLEHFGKLPAYQLYQIPERMQNEITLHPRVWTVDCPDNLRALFREYDKVAQIYSPGQARIFNID